MIVESYLYEKLDGDVQCKTCNHYCKLKAEKWGICRVRKNEKGNLMVYNYGLVSSMAVDPIEKKPFHNFKPGTDVLSFGSISCNFRCLHCQNYSIAFADLTYPYVRELKPEDVAELVVEKRADGVAWTYNEPGIWHEFALDASKEVKKRGDYYVVYVTNGYMSKEAIDQLDVLDAANVDVKAFSEEFYRRICKAKLERVLDTVEYMHRKGIFLEITYLVIPGENDSEEEIKEFAEWVCSMDKRIPVHFSRFHPDFQMTDKPSTPLYTLEMAVRVAKDVGLEYVYIGNVWGHEYEDTYCPNCGTKLIDREGFYIVKNELDGDRCPECGYRQNIVL
ncbi:AmmeMemoRadiSam system radical SAM enzyme [Archaeoglobus veneficus]|uniref:Radical SAM domain protein n=1 Tax=Archaeoglobus veneficus (strain DSM 11195 / SNP6) TaxID=693661 RepID=F2KS46_ARCVS|nr:AmmeMemoRadiSam system radical SAM enzyme [Archaeoglobus veneficus]AEA47985.1 Radical SAM domain protein [Archaeoglobus veneficus SNP6]